MIRRLGTLLVLALVLSVLPLGATLVLAAPPETTSVRITDLQGEDVAPAGGAFVRASAGAVDRSRPAAAAEPFAMVGLELPAGGAAEVRTSLDGRTWGPWLETELLGQDDGPDAGTDEAARARRGFTEAVWVGPSRFVQVAVAGGDVEDVAVVAIDPVGLTAEGTPEPPRTRLALGTPAAEAASVSGLAYVSRAEWGADESLRRAAPEYASDVRFAVVHHTAGSNDYTPEDAPAIVRGIYHYHTRTMGWDDIGYNVLVDRFGVVYEGRKGGLDRAVIGAHAAGYNTGSFGISVMGHFVEEAPPAVALAAMSETIAWKFRVHGIPAYGSARARNGTTVDTITAHRDVGSTACPGDAFYAQMDQVRGHVAGNTSPFVDTYGSVHSESIQRIAAAGVTSGCTRGRYCPGSLVTRGQMATFLTRTFDLPPGEPVTFSDVPPGHAHAAGISAAVAAGLASGYRDGNFRPEQLLKREQMAAMLQRGLHLEEEDGVRYVDTVASAYRGSINALSTAEITGGCDSYRYCPIDVVNRGQMASFLARTLDHLGR